MKWKTRLAIHPVLLFALAACNAPGIPLIGLDSNNVPTQVSVPEEEIAQRLEAAVNTVHESTIPALENRETRPGWMLRTVVVGLSTNIEIGVGPVKVGAVPRARLIFTNSTDPLLP